MARQPMTVVSPLPVLVIIYNQLKLTQEHVLVRHRLLILSQDRSGFLSHLTVVLDKALGFCGLIDRQILGPAIGNGLIVQRKFYAEGSA